MESKVNIKTSDVAHAWREEELKASCSRPTMLMIDALEPEELDPMIDYCPMPGRLLKGLNPRARATNRFRIMWVGENGERFTRFVTGMTELMDVVKPIIAAHEKNLKMLRKTQEKRLAQMRKESKNRALVRLGEHDRAETLRRKAADEKRRDLEQDAKNGG